MAKLFKKLYPTEDEPRYGESFRISGVQFIDIDGSYTDLIKCGIKKKDGDSSMIFEVGKNREEWISNRKKVEKLLLGIFDDLGVRFREVSRIKATYIGLSGEYLI